MTIKTAGRFLVLSALTVGLAFQVRDQLRRQRTLSYIADHRAWAVAEQRRSGVPAAITLAQAVVESDAGASELARSASNHFGIKCGKYWSGPSYAVDDDHPGECFRKYPTVFDSYRDHSDFLTSRPRYQPCFRLDIRDYVGWAQRLKGAGYATHESYADMLIDAVETFGLQEYTLTAMAPAGQMTLADAVLPAPR